jgi:peptidoglycan/xylan/chitin deacetylase (PgdA/CDA1 family)
LRRRRRGTPQPPRPLSASLLGHELEQLANERKVVALTFDAGANAAGVPSILVTLRRNGVLGTFFLTRRWVQVYPGLAREIGARYPVANHTYSHQQLPQLATTAVRSEIERAQSLVRTATGQDPRPLFRFPYGSSDRRTIRIVNTLGYTAIRWTINTLGWEGTARGQSAGSVANRVLTAPDRARGPDVVRVSSSVGNATASWVLCPATASSSPAQLSAWSLAS